MTGQQFLHPTDRRAKQRKLYGSKKWERVRALVLARDGYVCQVKASKKCRTTANVVDHIIRPEEGGAEYDPANLRASCRSCNMVRHNVSYFREKVDAAAAGEPMPARPPAPTGAILVPQRRSGRPATSGAAFVPWAMGLHGVTGAPADHRHGRWDVAPLIHLGPGVRFAVCPASCSSPVRWVAA